MLFQYQAGPRSSYLLISCRANGEVLPNGAGSLISGVPGSSRAVRSTTSTVAARSAAISESSTGMGCLPGQGLISAMEPQQTAAAGPGCEDPAACPPRPALSPAPRPGPGREDWAAASARPCRPPGLAVRPAR